MTADQFADYRANTSARAGKRLASGVAAISHGVSQAWDATTKAVSQTWDNTTKAVSQAWDATTKAVSQTWDNTTKAVSQAWDATVTGVANWANEHSTAIGVIAIIGGIAATAFLGPIGAAVVGGALLSGGMSVFSSKNADGTVNWGKVGLDSLIGGVAGGAGAGLVSAIGKLGFAANAVKGASAFTNGFSKASKGLSYLDDAAAATAKSEQLVESAASKSNWRIFSKAKDIRQANQFARQAETLTSNGNKLMSESDELMGVSGKYLDKARYYSNFADQKMGKAISGGLSGGIQNEYAYLNAGDHHDPLGAVTAFAGGTFTGSVSPLAPKSGNRVVDFGLDRAKDYASGYANYSSANWEHCDATKAQEKAWSSMQKGFLKGLGKEANTSLKNSDRFENLPFGI